MKVNIKLIFGNVFILLIVVACLFASSWQFSRLSERKELNAKIESRMNLSPTELSSDVATQSSNSDIEELEYRPVEIAGTFEEKQQVFVAGRSFDGEPGFNVLTPLTLENQKAIIYVNRGWIPQTLGDSILDGNGGEQAIEPEGGYETQRIVVGMIRKNEGKRIIGNSTMNEESRVSPRLSTQAFSVLFSGVEFQKVASFWVQEDYQKIGGEKVAKSSPAKEIFPKQIPKPELNERNHFSYAMQWLSFAVIAVITWIVILKKGRKARQLRLKQA